MKHDAMCSHCSQTHETIDFMTSDFIIVHPDICSKTQNSSVRLQAPLRSLSNWRYIKFMYSFIHSFVYYITHPIQWHPSATSSTARRSGENMDLKMEVRHSQSKIKQVSQLMGRHQCIADSSWKQPSHCCHK